MSGRRYKVLGSFGGGLDFSLRMDDEVTPLVKDLIVKTPGLAKRALRHVGFKTQQDMKRVLRGGITGMKQNVLDSATELSFLKERRYTSHRKKDGTLKKGKIRRAPHLPHKLKEPTTHHQMLKKHVRRAKRWMGSKLAKNRYMARAIGHDNKTLRNGVLVGWLSRSAIKWAKKYQTDHTQHVNGDMRRYFAAIGIPLRKNKTLIHRRGDPFIKPYFNKNRKHMIKMFENRIILKFNEMVAKRRA